MKILITAWARLVFKVAYDSLMKKENERRGAPYELIALVGIITNNKLYF